jgi:hypothetical protein
MTFKEGDRLVHKSNGKKLEVVGVTTKLIQVKIGRGRNPWMRREDLEENYTKEESK